MPYLPFATARWMRTTIPAIKTPMPTMLSVLQGAKLHIDRYPSRFGLLAPAGHKVIATGINVPAAMTTYNTVKPMSRLPFILNQPSKNTYG
jgi:hypothetical protein